MAKMEKLAKQVYRLTLDMAKEEVFGMSSHIQREAVSVSSNIAEGASRTETKEQGHYYQTAYASLMEVSYQLTLFLNLEYITEAVYPTT